MSVIVNDTGFHADDWKGAIVPFGELTFEPAVDLGPTDDPALLGDRLSTLKLIRVAFPAFSDGRGFSIARRLRDLGFAGRLRAKGHVLADQYTMARRCGFDEVEISAELATRQPQEHWAFRSEWQAHDYQARLRG